jgi:hypothetical protein
VNPHRVDLGYSGFKNALPRGDVVMIISNLFNLLNETLRFIFKELLGGVSVQNGLRKITKN